MSHQPYIQTEGKVVEMPPQFKHVMAIALDPRSGHRDGVIRCITSREGNVDVAGYMDRSVLHKVKGDSLNHFEIGEKLNIKNEQEIIAQISQEGDDFIGLEDPDIWIDEKTDLMYLYFTLPLINKTKDISRIYLGSAVGKDLDSLEMTMPVLGYEEDGITGGAKEVSTAPLNKNGVRLNLVESGEQRNDSSYSVVRVAIAPDMGKVWKFEKLAFHPADHAISWIAGHASPGPLLPESFINLGEGKRLGIMNGREANIKGEQGETLYGIFSIGLFIYDYENGIIEWVSPEPFIRDTDAKTITFASQFVETEKGEGILYAHIDDSFVRAYTLHAEGIQGLIPSLSR